MLGPTPKQIYQAYTFETDCLFNLYIMVYEKGIALDEPIDDENNTLLHKLAAFGTLKEVCEYLKEHKPKNMNPVNKKGQTPLQIATQNHRLLIAEQLKKMGAQPNASTMALSNHFTSQVFFILQIQKKLRQNTFFHLFDLYLDLMHVCQENHFDMNAPLDENGNRLLHLLIKNRFSAYIIDIFLRNHPNIDIHCRNDQNRTPIMIASALGDYKVIACLTKYGAKPYAKQPPLVPTVYEDLMAYIDNHLPAGSHHDKPTQIFELFMRYIIQKNWKYDPDYSQHSRDVVEKPADQAYTMNCIGLSQALFTLLHAKGVSWVNKVKLTPKAEGGKILLYPVDQSYPGVTGIFQCFDSQANETMKGKKFIRFIRHDFLQTSNDQKCYDPTFSCTYDNTDHVPVIKRSAAMVITPYRAVLAERLKKSVPPMVTPIAHLERNFATKCAI